MNNPYRILRTDTMAGVKAVKNYIPSPSLEDNTTSGWALGTTGTLTNAIPTGSPTFGSGASGNLSIAAANSAQIRDGYYLSLVSAAATTAGNMLHTDAMTIHSADKSQVLAYSFRYRATTNPTNGNWSGTSSNSFAVAAYDVTNSVWLGVVGNFSLTQSSGIGTASGTMQIGATTATLRFCIYNANASAGAITVDFDDFFLGPQVISSGPAVTDTMTYTPTIVGFGSPSAINFTSRRDGDCLEVIGSFTSGTSTSTAASITLGFNGTNANVTADTSKIGASKFVGKVGIGKASTTYFSASILSPASNATTVQFGIQTSAASEITPGANGDAIATSGVGVHFSFRIPIVGWSSNTQMSSDTDTRVCEVILTGSSTSLTSSVVTVAPTTVTADTHGAWSGSTFTCPITGFYQLQATLVGTSIAQNSSSGFAVGYRINSGSDVYMNTVVGQASVTVQFTASGSAKVYLTAGQTVQFRAVASVTQNATAFYASISRDCGPSVITATETVSFSANTSTTAGTTSQCFIYTVKDHDTHNAYSTSTGKFTVPVSGKYVFGSTSFAGASGFAANLYKNTVFTVQGTRAIASNSPGVLTHSLSLVAGDIIEIRPDASVTASGGATINTFYGYRVGN